MIQKRFDEITKDDIEALITDGVTESKTLEYKQELPGRSSGAKKEFLADVSSFANASGGDIIYGLKAAVDDSGKKTGAPESVLPITGVTADQAKLRLEQMIRNGIAPRLQVQIEGIPDWGDDGQDFVILLRVRNSFASPHMVKLDGTQRFFSRNSAEKYQLDVDELRMAFLATESQADRIRGFLQDRIAQIVADETPVPLSSPGRLVLHVIPVASFLNNDRLDLSTDHNELRRNFHPPRLGRFGSDRHNLDGFLSYDMRAENEVRSYCQLYRNGAVEAVHADILYVRDGARSVSVGYERSAIDAVVSYLDGLRELDVAPPEDSAPAGEGKLVPQKAMCLPGSYARRACLTASTSAYSIPPWRPGRVLSGLLRQGQRLRRRSSTGAAPSRISKLAGSGMNWK